MILTEEEAKTKWCPEVRTGLNAGMAVNRHVADAPGAIDGVYDETRCRGSACMAWRWHNDGLSDYPPDTKGFCGKAGRP